MFTKGTVGWRNTMTFLCNKTNTADKLLGRNVFKQTNGLLLLFEKKKEMTHGAQKYRADVALLNLPFAQLEILWEL